LLRPLSENVEEKYLKLKFILYNSWVCSGREHSPELPKKYVYTECQTIRASTIVEYMDGGHQYEPPAACGACGATSFVTEADPARTLIHEYAHA